MVEFKRFSIVVTLDPHDGRYIVHVTDYETGRSTKSFLWRTERAAQAEGRRIVTAMQYGTSAPLGEEATS